MTRVKLEVANLKEIQAALDEVGEDLDAIIYRAAEAGAEPIFEEIKQRAPRDGGSLAASGFKIARGRISRDGANAIITLSKRDGGAKGSDFERAFYLEFGADNRRRGGDLPSRPFIRPAFEAMTDEAQAQVAAVIKKELKL